MNPPAPQFNRPWWIGCLLTTIVAGGLSLFFMGFLVTRTVVQSRTLTRHEDRLDAIRHQLLLDPGNAALIAEIRQLDVHNRWERTARLDGVRRCVWLLLGSVVILVIAAKGLHLTRLVLPLPQPQGDVQAQWLRQGAMTRRGLGGVLLLLGVACGLGLWTGWTVTSPTKPPPPVVLDFAANWARFRGPQGAGVSQAADVPLNWDGPSMKNIRWKTAIPLEGRSSPVVWGDRVFVSGGHGTRLEVYCFDANNGTLLWTGQVPENPQATHLTINEDTGWAAGTMACDGRRVYAIFSSGDIGCFDLEGKRLWTRALGIPDSAYSYATSLATYQNRVIIQYDQGDDTDHLSQLIAIDGPTGHIAWKTPRPVANVWTSPIVARVAGRDQLLTVSSPWTMGYDPVTGRELWRAQCVQGDLAPSPIVAGDLCLACEPYDKVVALRCDGQGDVTKTHGAWTTEEGAPDITSPVSNGTWVCLLDSSGGLLFLSLKDGHVLFRHEVDGAFQASPSWVDDKLYVLSQKGVMTIAQVGKDFKILAQNKLGDQCEASPAFIKGRIFIRGKAYMWCVGK